MSCLTNNCCKSFLSYRMWLMKWKTRNLRSLFSSITIFTWGNRELWEEGVKNWENVHCSTIDNNQDMKAT